MKLIILTLVILSNVFATLPAKSETVLEKIKRTGLLEVAMREDAIPFGYRDSNNNLQGLCLDFIQLLREELKHKLNLQIISVKIYKSTLFNRFQLLENKTVDFECGPNSIRKTIPDGVSFSRPFFVTGTQFLVRSDNQNNFNFSSSLEGISIGVLRDTTTQELLRQKYPLATYQEFQGVTGRLRGIQSLRRNRIDAFASDGILLIGEAVILGLSLGKDYQLIPPNPLNCDYYGFILPANDPQWQEFINGVIVTSENRNIFKKWFTEVASYFRDTWQYCRNNPEKSQ
ncbi:amino acid ABC transporter substrate-binding protein [Microcystis aeruginosa]|uniref:amino acid ABC transporter substrate-binding protein n=1 Tax=Microcystis aeruginosa TaxID=1126 RepID=UPI00026202C6|nr:amino acid ABC transporter substrate-binding protein [Microcystis aeruginosa]CCI09044.1 Similar to Q4C5X9_CROWT Extracellular solute-binding protein [Microcystis aeruginosa PCC 7941]